MPTSEHSQVIVGWRKDWKYREALLHRMVQQAVPICLAVRPEGQGAPSLAAREGGWMCGELTGGNAVVARQILPLLVSSVALLGACTFGLTSELSKALPCPGTRQSSDL